MKILVAGASGLIGPAVVRQLVELAEKTGRLCDPRDLLKSLEAREELCSTALPGGLALLARTDRRRKESCHGDS